MGLPPGPVTGSSNHASTKRGTYTPKRAGVAAASRLGCIHKNLFIEPEKVDGFALGAGDGVIQPRLHEEGHVHT